MRKTSTHIGKKKKEKKMVKEVLETLEEFKVPLIRTALPIDVAFSEIHLSIIK